MLHNGVEALAVSTVVPLLLVVVDLPSLSSSSTLGHSPVTVVLTELTAAVDSEDGSEELWPLTELNFISSFKS